MIRIYLVTSGIKSDYEVLGAFSSFKKAEEFVKKIDPKDEFQTFIEDHIIDPLTGEGPVSR